MTERMRCFICHNADLPVAERYDDTSKCPACATAFVCTQYSTIYNSDTGERVEYEWTWFNLKQRPWR